MLHRTRFALLAAPLLALGLGACGDDAAGPEGTAQLTVALTDAPGAMFSEAIVDIGEILLIPAGDGPPVMLTADGGMHDLLDLQNGIMADLATLSIDPGEYVQLRLVVEGASVTLADGMTFVDGTDSRDLFVPSGAHSGIKVNLRYADGDDESAGIEIASGETILVVVDMDVSKNFRLQGNPDTPAGIHGVLFTPLLRATLEDVAGSISGTITYASATPDEETERAEITADLKSSPLLEELQTASASATAAADGTYTIWFLSPGTYDVSAAATIDATEYTAGPTEVTVGDDEDVTGVDFTL